MQHKEIFYPRIAALRNEMLKHKLDAFISSFLPTMRYLCGYSGSNGLLIVTERSTFFLTDFRYKEIIKTEVFAETKIIGKGSLISFAAEKNILSKKAKIGFEEDRVTVSYLEVVKKYINAKKLIAVSGIVESLRAVKDDSEIRTLQQAFGISDQVFQKILGFISPGMSELELSAEISYLHKKFGSETDSFNVIVASGVRGSLPHGTASAKKIKNREFVTLDFGCIVDGYHSDMTRTICIGKPTAEMKNVYHIVQEAQHKACIAVRNGVPAKMIDGIARKFITKKGFGTYFGHSLGHGVGLEIHELPRIAPKSKETLVTGNVVTIEPGIYIPKKFGVRIEDTIVVGENGSVLLTGSSKELITI